MRGGVRSRWRSVVTLAVVSVAFAVLVAPVALGRALHGKVYVYKSGNGSGTVIGEAGGVTVINCGSTCYAQLKDNTDSGYVPLTLTPKPDPGSVFKGWIGCSGPGDTCVIGIQRLVTISPTARFDLDDAKEFPVTVTLDGQGAVVSTPAGISCGTVCAANFPRGSSATLVATPAPGWTFAGWSGACAGTATCVVTISQAQSVTATFSPPTLPLSVAVAGQGSITSSPAGLDCSSACVGNLPGGSTVTLTATPAPGAVLVGWGGACSGSGPTCAVSLASLQAVTATFSDAQGVPLAVAVTGSGRVVSAPSGVVCGANCGAVFAPGARITLTAKPAAGWRLGGWGLACRDVSPTCVVRLAAGRGVTAQFVRRSESESLAVTKTGNGRITSLPKGIDCGARCTARLPTNSKVTLVATPGRGNLFVRWTGDCTGAKPTCNLTMTRSRTVAAEFAASTDKTAPVVRALASDGDRATGARLRYRVTEAGGSSRETAVVYAGRKKLATVVGPMDALDPDVLFDFLVWKPKPSVAPGTYRFCVTSVDPSENVSRPACATVRLR